MKQDLTVLKKENKILSRPAGYDCMTGIYNCDGTEAIINQLLTEKRTGVLFVLGLDQFKQINDSYGHIAGDSVIQEVVRILGHIILRHDILGRVGGVKFVIYMSLAQNQNFIDERCCQIRNRLLGLQMTNPHINGISATVCGCLYQSRDNYKSLFDRANRLLLIEEQKKILKPVPTVARKHSSAIQKDIDVDTAQIRTELSEKDLASNTYCRDFETFKSIYHFVKCRARRSGESVYIILFTLNDKNGNLPILQIRELQMDTLKSAIQHSLRPGEVFTQYSSCQYIVMVSDADSGNIEWIAQSITETFYAEIEDMILLHCCYPLRLEYSREKS